MTSCRGRVEHSRHLPWRPLPPRAAPDRQESERRDKMRGAAIAARLAVYRYDRQDGKPNKTAELTFGTSQRTAARWVAQARERGLL